MTVSAVTGRGAGGSSAGSGIDDNGDGAADAVGIVVLVTDGLGGKSDGACVGSVGGCSGTGGGSSGGSSVSRKQNNGVKGDRGKEREEEAAVAVEIR